MANQSVMPGHSFKRGHLKRWSFFYIIVLSVQVVKDHCPKTKIDETVCDVFHDTVATHHPDFNKQ